MQSHSQSFRTANVSSFSQLTLSIVYSLCHYRLTTHILRKFFTPQATGIQLTGPPSPTLELFLWISCVRRFSPVAITQRASPYVLLLFLSSFFFFIQHEISAVSRRFATKLCHMIGNGCNFLKTRSKIWGPLRKKFGAENMLFSARFRTSSHLDREYLRNGTRHRQSENGVANYDLSRVC